LRAVKWLLPYVKPYRFKMIFGFALDLIIILTNLINPVISGKIVADVIQGTRKDLLPTYLLIMMAATLIRSVCRYTMLMCFETSSQNALFHLRGDLYERVERQTFTFFDENRVGDIMARMTGDLEAIRFFIAYDTYAVPENLLLFVSAIVMMFTLNAALTAGLLVIVPVMGVTAFKMSRRIKPAFRNTREQFSNLNSTCEENIGGNRVVKAFAREEYEIEKFNAANGKYYEANTNTALIRSRYFPVIALCASSLPFVSLFFGSLLIINGRMQLWQLITFNGYLWMIDNPTRMFGNFVNEAQNFLTSLDKIYEMMRKRVHIHSPGEAFWPESEEGEDDENEIKGETVRAYEPDAISGAVEFDNVSFSYDRHHHVPLILKNVSFRAERGQTIGIVGPTGCGKTTLALLIGRYYEAASGNVRVDGRNVKDFGLVSLRRGIAYAMQDVFLFSDTIEGNVAYGNPDITMETVESSADAADASEFINQAPEGYDTIVGERGVGLSGGQKQRLSLARALAIGPSILILDDTTSAVDMETERRIQKALDGLAEKKPRTTFIIAHRLLSVKNADLIIVLENGEITERGTHESLMELGGYYAGLYLEQQGLSSGGELLGA
jgi:ATP-binding cassette subfamily B protein